MRSRSGPFTAVLIAAALVAAVVPAPSVAVTTAAAPEVEYRWTAGFPQPAWLMDAPSHAAIDASGNVYVADRDNNRVQKYGADGRLLKQWGALGLGDGLFKAPSAIAVSPDAKSVYVADTGNHRIQRFDSNGNHIRTWGRVGGPDLTGSGDGEFNAPSGIAVGPDGKVYVVDKNNARIQRFDAAGNFLSKWGSPGSTDGFFLNPTSIGIDGWGDVYVTDTNCFRVQKFTATGTFVLKWGMWDTTFSGKGLFRKPVGIGVDHSGNVVVTDEVTRWVQVFDRTGNFLCEWGGAYSKFDSGFVTPAGATCDDKGNVYIADTGVDRLAVYTLSGKLTRILGSYGVNAGRFHSPGGVAVAGDGHIAVADTENHRIQQLAADGTGEWALPLTSFPVPGLKGSEFNLPQGVAYDQVGNIFSADTGNGRIQKHGPVGNYITQWGSTGTGDGWFKNPTGVAVGSNGHVYVADRDNSRIQEFDGQGGFIRKWGVAGTGDGQFSKPTALVVGPDGDVWVADSGNNRVQRFSSVGVFKAKWGTLGTALGQMKNPCGIALDANGKVLIADTDNNRVDVFTATGAFVQAFGVPGSWHGEFFKPTSVAVGPSGEVLVADKGNQRLQRFMPHLVLRVSVTGVGANAAYRTPVSPSVTFTGQDVISTRIELNGAPWTPQTLSADGRYTLWAWAKDDLGAESSVTVPFVIDTHAPATSSDAIPSYTDGAVITLKASDDLSGVSKTYWRLDGGPLQTSMTAKAVAGVHSLAFWSVDRAGNTEGVKSVPFTVRASTPPTVDRVWGGDRYATAVDVSKHGFPTGAAAAVVAFGDNYPDALSAAPLARAYGGPMLLTKTAALPSGVLTELKRLAPKRVFVVGSASVVSDHVRDQLIALPSAPTVTRLGGQDRFDTAAQVASVVKSKVGGVTKVVVVTGLDYPSAMIAAPLAAAEGWPVLLTRPEGLPSYTATALSSLKAPSALVVGTTAEVSDAVFTKLPTDRKRITSVTGDRYETAGLVFDYAKKMGKTPSHVALAVGGNFPDALSAGPYLARDAGFLLLTGTSSLHAQAATRLIANKIAVRRLDVLGSTGAISDAAMTQAGNDLK